MIEIEMLTKNPMYQVKDANCITLGKRAIKDKIYDYETEKDFWWEMFISEHSTLRSVLFRIVDTEMRSDISAQLLRATKGHPQPICQSHRPDWNNSEPRKPSNETFGLFEHIHTAESFMSMCRQRLCYSTMKETRQKVLEVLEVMHNMDSAFFNVLAECCVPQCVYRLGCCDRKNCKHISHFLGAMETDNTVGYNELNNIKTRYEMYWKYMNV